jgi:hypothetical protein
MSRSARSTRWRIIVNGARRICRRGWGMGGQKTSDWLRIHSMPALSKHRWYQFSIKTLLAGITIVAIGLGWIARERQKSYELQQALTALQKSALSVHFDEKSSRRPTWLKILLGDDRPSTATEFVWIYSDDDLALVSKFPRVQELYLHGELFSDVGLKHLSSLHELRVVHLGDSRVSDESVRGLKGLAKLEVVELWQTNVTDKGLIHLAGLPHLSRLRLDHSQCTGTGLEALRKNNKLKELSLCDCPVTKKGIASLRGLKHLQVLDLTNWKRIYGDGPPLATENDWLSHLSELTELRDLDLFGRSISDSGMGHLAGLTNLTKLNLSATQITDTGLRELSRLSRLEELDLYRTKVNGSGFKYLASLPNLRVLDLRETQATDKAVAELQTALPMCVISRESIATSSPPPPPAD